MGAERRARELRRAHMRLKVHDLTGISMPSLMPSLLKYFITVGAILFVGLVGLNAVLEPGGPGPRIVQDSTRAPRSSSGCARKRLRRRPRARPRRSRRSPVPPRRPRPFKPPPRGQW